MWQPGPVCTSCLQTRPSPRLTFCIAAKNSNNNKKKKTATKHTNHFLILTDCCPQPSPPVPPLVSPCTHPFLGTLCRHAPIFFFSFLSLFTRISLSVRIIRNFFLRPVFSPPRLRYWIQCDRRFSASPSRWEEPVLCTELHPLQSICIRRCECDFRIFARLNSAKGEIHELCFFCWFFNFEKDSILQIYRFLDDAIIWL